MKQLITIFLFILTLKSAQAQNIGIGTTTPNASAQLDISSTSKGVLLPRLTAAQRDGIVSPAVGLMVFSTTDNSFYFFDGTWRRLIPADEAWSIKGNSGTNAATHFIGNVDNKPLTFKVNNAPKMVIDGEGRVNMPNFDFNLIIGDGAGSVNTGSNNHFVGYRTGNANTTGSVNYFSGTNAGPFNTEGSENYFSGYTAGFNNTIGNQNHFTGNNAGESNRTGNFNHFEGFGAGFSNTSGSSNYFSGYRAGVNSRTGDFNHFSGFEAGVTNQTGKKITLIGYQTSVASGNLENAAAIGYKAKVSANNSFVIGGMGVDAVNVGIGTTAPQQKLHVEGNTLINGDLSVSGKIISENFSSQFTSVSSFWSPPPGLFPPQFKKTKESIVRLSGTLQNTQSLGSIDAIMVTLPVGYRPTQTISFAVPNRNGSNFLRIDIDSSGNISYMTAAANVVINLDSISFVVP